MKLWILSIAFFLVVLLSAVPLMATDAQSEITVKANCFVECKASANGRLWLEVPVLIVTDPFSGLTNVTWTDFFWDIEGYVSDPATQLGFGGPDLNQATFGGVFGKNAEAGPFEINFCEMFERVFAPLDAPSVWQLRVELTGRISDDQLPLPDEFVPTVPWIKNFTGSFRRTSRGPLVSDAAKDQVLDPTRGIVTGVAKTTCQLTNWFVLPFVPD